MSTSQSRAPDAFTHRDSLFSGIVSIAAEAIIATDAEFRILVFNSGAERIFGYPAAEVLGRSLELLIPPRFRTSHALRMRRFEQSQVSARRMGERQQISGLRKNGEEFPAEASILQLREDDRAIFAVVLRDVTVQRHAEERQRFLVVAGEALAGSLDYARTLERIVRMPMPILGDACVIDLLRPGEPEYTIVAHADGQKEDLMREMRERFPPILGAQPFARVLETRQSIVADRAAVESAISNATDEQRAIAERLGVRSAMMTPLISRGQAIGAIGFHSASRQYDADDRALAEDFARVAALAIDSAFHYEQMQRALRARDEMVGIVSHDLRNPVQAVKMLTGAATRRDDGDVPDELREQFQMIRRAADQMDELIQALLDVTRIEAGRFHVAPAPVDPGEIVDTALEMLAPLARDREIALERDLADAVPAVAADVARVAQVLSNLVGNALKFTHEGGRITVRTAPGDGVVLFAVSDTGDGIPADQLPHIFDRFRPYRRATQSGAGLGLPISRGIIEAHGGRIWMESEVGVGTTTYFTLPLADGNVPGDDP
jgi:PAS domain S-box-containing protein